MSQRSVNVREIERALNGIEGEYGINVHIQRVLSSFENTIKDINSMESTEFIPKPEVPELYLEIVGYLVMCTEHLAFCTEALKKILEVM